MTYVDWKIEFYDKIKVSRLEFPFLSINDNLNLNNYLYLDWKIYIYVNWKYQFNMI